MRDVLAPGTTSRLSVLADAARDARPVSGWTHNFYKYPARFSPEFARAAIEQYSTPGDVIADPYMGGGTTIVEGLLARRRPMGNDLNSLAVFVARVKTTPLHQRELVAISKWVADVVPEITYRVSPDGLERVVTEAKLRNMDLPRSRFIKKYVATALISLDLLPTEAAKRFVRCAILRTAQWALDGRRMHTTLVAFRERLAATATEMLGAIKAFAREANLKSTPTLLSVDAAVLHQQAEFQHAPVSLVVTSPPYPGVHVLYHRWQVDGRRETPAPYWIAGCSDGQGPSFYNFGTRLDAETNAYFATSLATLHSIRRVMKRSGCMVQLIAFNRPEEQLPRYLENMREAGFRDASGRSRIWRDVPNRKWHANLIGRTHSAREVVLVHRAV